MFTASYTALCWKEGETLIFILVFRDTSVALVDFCIWPLGTATTPGDAHLIIDLQTARWHWLPLPLGRTLMKSNYCIMGTNLSA